MKPTPLYPNSPIGLGKQPYYYPNQFVEGSNLAAGETIPFGRAVGTGDVVDGTTIVGLSRAGLTRMFRGISAESTEAKDPENGSYLVGDPIGIVTTGVVIAHAEESVNSSLSVRIRIQDHSTDQTKRAGNFCASAISGETVTLNGAEYKSESAADGKVVVFLSDSIQIVPD
ncbi:structural cement protein Gp24 [Leptospira santarosai]|uniref:structural cement protein Gp24 n=1 Tax=Leptospira santarosai TaxID=28183 RepID=UPI000774A904|nr:hypothetical protein [Leptospira santarosai]